LESLDFFKEGENMRIIMRRGRLEGGLSIREGNENIRAV
jgi:hypothetical protein